MNERIDGYMMLFALSDFIPVMTEAEVLLILNGRIRVNVEMVTRWERLLVAKNASIQATLKTAYAKQR